ncbi:hypothetical protein TRL7639_04562 [Falsiruegeria litorea R37]|uniref:Uncharacterized protein n=1 Tax=Falsiruegeria litorea R37 TaxID=1200284 RepID=A0A1Y5TW27_9RHOB|nr:hypothetical protein TRL7639_04562 [Falsiruegeria litorea R37]
MLVRRLVHTRRVLGHIAGIDSPDHGGIAGCGQRQGGRLCDCPAMAVCDLVAQADRPVVVRVRCERETVCGVAGYAAMARAEAGDRQRVAGVDVGGMFQELRRGDLHRLVLGAGGQGNRGADGRAVIGARHGDDEVFGVGGAGLVGDGDGDGDLLRRARGEVLVGRIRGIEAPGAVGAQGEAGHGVGRGKAERIAGINIRGRHLARHGTSVFRRRGRRRAQNRHIIGSMDRDLDLVCGAIGGAHRNRVDQSLTGTKRLNARVVIIAIVDPPSLRSDHQRGIAPETSRVAPAHGEHHEAGLPRVRVGDCQLTPGL